MADLDKQLESICAQVTTYLQDVARQSSKPKRWYKRAFSWILKHSRWLPKFLAYAVVTLVPSAIALYTISQTIPGLSPNNQNLALPRLRFGVANASSYRQDARGLTAHSVQNLLDNNPKTTWVECKPESPDRPPVVNDGSSRLLASQCATPTHKRMNDPKDGRLAVDDEGIAIDPPPHADKWVAGESVTLPLTEPTSIKAIGVRNGDEASQHEYYRSPRARDIQVEAWTCQSYYSLKVAGAWQWRPWKWHQWNCQHPNNQPRGNLCFRQHLLDEEGYQTFGVPGEGQHLSAKEFAKEVGCDGSGEARLTSGLDQLEGVTQIRITIKSAYDGEDQFDGNSQTVTDAASTDLALSDLELIPVSMPR